MKIAQANIINKYYHDGGGCKMIETIKEKKELYINSIFEKVYFTNSDMVLCFKTIKDREEFNKLIDRYIKLT